MSEPSPAAPSSQPASAGRPPAATVSAEVDLSCRWPLLVFLSKGAGWLALGAFLLVLAAIKLHGPGFLADSAWLGVGRLKPAAWNVLVYGFACQFGFGLSLWLIARLGRAPLLNAPLLFAGGVLWNIGVLVGVIGILGGASTGFAYLEMPRGAWPLLGLALLVIALWALLNFHYRREPTTYPSQWFVVGGIFWLAWIASAAVYLLVFHPVRGVMQAVVQSWYAHNLFQLWLTPVTVALVFYFVPKLTGRTLFSREWAQFAFWTLAIFGGWGGMTRLGGGPLPNWMISVGVVANVFVLIPVGFVAWNLYQTVEGKLGRLWESLVLRFMTTGLVALLLAEVLNALTSFRAVGQVTLFTLLPVAVDHLWILGAFGLVSSGAVYFVLPRVLGGPPPRENLSRWHFNLTVVGLGLHVVALVIGGLAQGAAYNNSDVELARALRSALPFVGISTLGLLLFCAGQVLFLVQVQLWVCSWMMPLCASLKSACLASTEGATKAEVKP